MRSIKKTLMSRFNRNASLIVKARKKLSTIQVEGGLKTGYSHQRIQFYQRTNENQVRYKYLGKKDRQLLTKLAEKEYNKAVVALATKENEWIKKTLESMPEKLVDNIYSDNPERRALIKPYTETDEEAIKRWESKSYEGLGFAPEAHVFITDKGEKVRSKSEQLIANKLYQMRIPYRYEYRIFLEGFGYVHPDFTIYNVYERKDYIHEHLGMMDDPIYIRDVLGKLRAYENNGIFIGDRLIVTWEDSTHPFDVNNYEKQLRAIMNMGNHC